MTSTVQIRGLTRDDLTRVAEVHVQAFRDSAITKLGKEAARRYYEWQLTGPHDCQAIGAFIDGALAGFCFGGVFRGAMSGFLRANRLFLIGRVLVHPYLLADPLFRSRLFDGLHVLRRFRRSQAPTRQTRKKTPDAFLSMAVDPRWQRRGKARLS